MANKVTSILHKLRKAGYNPVFEESKDYTVDDCINLSPTVSIQICQDGALGIAHPDADNPEEHVMYPYVDSIEEVLEQIKQYEIVI
jgi:hypothetical protein